MSKSDIALDVNANVEVSKQAGNDSPPETERKAEVVEVKKGTFFSKHIKIIMLYIIFQ